MWPDLQPPYFFAHRGARTYAPENTLAAFTLAARQGAPAIELDVRFSADRQVVVLHDATVDRTTDGSGRVTELPLSVLRTLDAGSWFSPDFKGERIPTLDEVFETVGRQMFVNVELANYAVLKYGADPDDGMVASVVEIVRRHALQARVMFSSFNAGNLRRAHALLPEVPCGLLTGEPWRRWQVSRSEWTAETYAALHPFLAGTTRWLVRRAHARGRRVHVWTVNSPAGLRYLRAIGVDGVFCDDPLLARRVFLEGA